MQSNLKLTTENEVFHLFLHAMVTTGVFNTALTLGFFEYLKDGFKSVEDIKKSLGLKVYDRNIWDFLDKLVMVGVLEREGKEKDAKYRNTKSTNVLFTTSSKDNLIPIVDMYHKVQNKFEKLPELLKSDPETYGKGFDVIYSDLQATKIYLHAMKNLQMANFEILATQIPNIKQCKTVTDIGGALGVLASQIKINNPDIHCISFDLPFVMPIAKEYIESLGLVDKIELIAGDFFKDEFPKSDCFFFGNILHDWDLKTKQMLLKKSFNALNEKGFVIIIENFIDNERLTQNKAIDISNIMTTAHFKGYNFTSDELGALGREFGFQKSEYIQKEKLEIVILYK